MTLRLTTRGIKTAEAIRDRVEFKTSGSLEGVRYPDMAMYFHPGWLNATEADKFRSDCRTDSVDYIVWSYGTPIAWHSQAGWHRVDQKFSPTTTKHQGNLYLIGDAALILDAG